MAAGGGWIFIIEGPSFREVSIPGRISSRYLVGTIGFCMGREAGGWCQNLSRCVPSFVIWVVGWAWGRVKTGGIGVAKYKFGAV